jgi:DNA ligase-1
MDYAEIVGSYEKIEATTKRLEMTSHLVELLKKTPKEVIARVVYLTQGKLYPDFVGIEMGVAEKLAKKPHSRDGRKRKCDPKRTAEERRHR